MSAFYSKKISLSANDSRKNEDFCGNFGNGSSENSKKSAESDIFTRNSLKSSGYRYKKCRNRSKKAGKAKKRR
jgi:hypothetical protein